MVATFFQRVARHFANEVAVVTPNGQLLSHSLEDGLKKWRQMSPAERKHLDDLGKYDDRLDPASASGGLIFKVYARGLVRDAAGRLQIYKTDVARSWEPGRDHLWLTAAEARALVPVRPRKGDHMTVPQPVVDRFCRYCLIDLVRVGGNGGPRRPDEVLAKEMILTVEEVADGVIRLRLDGSARLATHDVGSGARGKEPKVDRFRLAGRASYDGRKKAFTRFDIVAFSETGHFDEIHRKVLPLGVAFELTRGKTPADRLPPASFGKEYFAKGK
jgi:hypothetical protein